VKHLSEFRDPQLGRALLDTIASVVTRPWTIMEICGGQTHAIMRHGLDQLLPAPITLVHGPGCPVCVTPLETIDRALAIAERPEVIFTTYGDMLRVPGSRDDLARVRSRGGDVRMV
jgi:hydrogenase expression/formation protein HypD